MAVGYKGQFIFVVPEKNLVVVFTGDLPGRDFPIPSGLLQNYIIPSAEAVKPLPSNTEQQARLIALVNSVAKTIGFTWTSEKEGMAKDGVFRRTTSPAFKFEYPLGSKKAATDAPGQVMKMKTPSDVAFSASIGDIPEGMRLEDFGPKFYSKELESVGSSIKVISNKEIRLNCGTKAYRTDITWLWNNALPITTYLVTAYKDGKIIFVCTHPWKYHDKFEPIVQSLSFNF